jgi:ribosomal protein S18 acetylase RimI-like enzyme
VSERFSIRPATRNDLPVIVCLIADDGLGRGREDTSEPLAACYTAAFEAMECDPNNEIVVMEHGGAIVGCLQLTFIPGLSRQGARRAQIESVRIASALRGQGLGRRLFEWAIARAKERNCRLVQLTTDKSRDNAHHFYESLGFVASHEGMKLAL